MTNNTKSSTVELLFTGRSNRSFYPIDGGRMYKINLWEFYFLASEVHRLTEIKQTMSLSEVSDVILDAKVALNYFFGEWSAPMKLCESELKTLNKMMDMIQAQYSKTPKDNISAGAIRVLAGRVKEFESAFRKQCEFLDTYYVKRKGAFDTTALIDQTEQVIINDAVRNRLPEQAIYDLKQAGKCIAFEIPNAAGFHTIRAIEAVVRLYYEKVIGVLPKPKDRNWGAYIRNLRSAKADEKIVSALDHIREHYRNPILHPEERLEFEDAFTLFNFAISIIIRMTKEVIALEGVTTKN